jgi:predicted Zn-dependent protease
LHAVPALRPQVLAQQERARRARQRERMWRAVALLAIVLFVVAGYYGIRGASGLALHMLPVSVDQKLGDHAIEAIDLGGTRVHDETLRSGLDQIVQRLAQHARPAGFRFTVHVVDAETVNAFALPGGHMVVYTGLLRAAGDASEVAGVLGHEMAHVTRRHGMSGLVHALGVTAVISLVLGDVGGLSALAVEMLKTGTLTSYGRDQERDADREGVRMVHAAGIDPTGLARFFETLERKGSEVPGALSWLSSHPHSAERRASVEAHAKELGAVAPRPLALDWPALQRRAGSVGKPAEKLGP